MSTDIFFDAEWFFNQKIFLIGYAYNLKKFGQLYDRSLTKSKFLDLLKPVDGFIYFYGPDIGMFEKYFKIDIRHKYKCVNLMPIFNQLTPDHVENHKLATYQINITNEKEDLIAVFQGTVYRKKDKLPGL